MKYNEDYAADTLRTYMERHTEDFKKAQYVIEIEPSFNEPPVLEVLRVVSNLEKLTEDNEITARITKMCIVGKTVRLYKDNELMNGGTLQINSINDSFDAYPIFRSEPRALQQLMQTCVGFILEKHMPSPQKQAEGQTAKKTQ